MIPEWQAAAYNAFCEAGFIAGRYSLKMEGMQFALRYVMTAPLRISWRANLVQLLNQFLTSGVQLMLFVIRVNDVKEQFTPRML